MHKGRNEEIFLLLRWSMTHSIPVTKKQRKLRIYFGITTTTMTKLPTLPWIVQGLEFSTTFYPQSALQPQEGNTLNLMLQFRMVKCPCPPFICNRSQPTFILKTLGFISRGCVSDMVPDCSLRRFSKWLSETSHELLAAAFSQMLSLPALCGRKLVWRIDLFKWTE